MLFTSSRIPQSARSTTSAEKFPLRHFRGVKFGVAAHVLDADRHLEKIARLANVVGGRLGGCESVGHRQQIVRVASIDAAPAKMVGQPRRLGAFDQPLEFLQMLAIEPVGRAEIHRHAMLHDAVLLEDLIEHFERTAAIDHEIFRDDLEPIDDRLLLQNVPVMRHAQADADAVVGEIVEWICRHGDRQDTAVGEPEDWTPALANSRNCAQAA